MKVYTIKDLESFERDELGYLICPSGDYTQICSFGECCRFDESCSFGDYCRFGEGCSFGEYCSFSKRCDFGVRCRFDESCSFGEGCSFGEWCSFGEYCSFGEWCHFDEGCSFGGYCSFGECCNLDNLRFENITENVDRVLKIDRIGSRKGCTYFFKTLNEIYVRCGCFLGTIAEFEAKVNSTLANNEQYRNEYLGAIKYAKSIL